MVGVTVVVFVPKVSDDGVIRLKQDSEGTLEVFEADVDTRAAGTVYYGLRDDIGILRQYADAAAALDSRFASCYDRAFTVTWDSVGYFDEKSDLVSDRLHALLYHKVP